MVTVCAKYYLNSVFLSFFYLYCASVIQKRNTTGGQQVGKGCTEDFWERCLKRLPSLKHQNNKLQVTICAKRNSIYKSIVQCDSRGRKGHKKLVNKPTK